jgi:putative ABC transport system permease protein
VESTLLSCFGGMMGIALGLASAGLGTIIMNIPFVFQVKIIVIAFAFSSAVGIVFGYFPARKAAQLDPIEALRHE